MSAILFAAAIAAAQPAAAAPAEAVACKREGATAVQSFESPGPRKLGELPPGSLYRAVLRRVGDCDIVEVHKRGAWTLKPAGRVPHATPARKGW